METNIKIGAFYHIGIKTGAIGRADEVDRKGNIKFFMGSRIWIKLNPNDFRLEETSQSPHIPDWLQSGMPWMDTIISEVRRGPVVLANGTMDNIANMLKIKEHEDTDNTDDNTDVQVVEEDETETEYAEIVEESESNTDNTTGTTATDTTDEVQFNVNIQSAVTPGGDAITSAFMPIFAQVERNVTNAVIDACKPFLSKIDRREIYVVSEKGRIKVEGKTHAKFEMVCKLIAMRKFVFLYGKPGTGKSYLARQVAQALGLVYYFANKLDDVFDVTGYQDANGNFRDKPFYHAFTEGGLFNIDEVDASFPPALTKLNEAMANGYFDFPGIGNVKAHPDFRVIVSGNTLGRGTSNEWSGTRQPLDPAFLDRFGATIVCDYDPDLEKACAGNDDEILDFCHELRRVIEDYNIPNSYVSMRLMQNLADYKGVFDDVTALQIAFTNKYLENRDDLSTMFGGLTCKYNRYYAAFETILNS